LRNIRLILEYVGTNYHGWQFQPNVPTIQGTLEDKLFLITQEHLKVVGAGRTDAGVHALGQVANFITQSTIPITAFNSGLNSVLPHDIVVLEADEASHDFDARKSAKSKGYLYSILNRKSPSAVRRNLAWWIPETLDLNTMIEAVRCIPGKRDFSSFQAAEHDMPDPHKTILSCSLNREDDMILLDIEADGFLRHMVRIIMGTLVEVGRGKLTPSHIEKIIEARDRRKAGPTAPPHGLCLVGVRY